MKPIIASLALSTLLLATACDRNTAPPVDAKSQAAATNAQFARADWPLPITGRAAQPDLIATVDGRLLLSWIEVEANGHALRVAHFERGQWSAPQQIARGDDWFVNWADTPHLASTDDGALWAHWLPKSSAGKYAYDVALVRSGDGGATWSSPTLVNNDGTATEHGFVSLWPASRNTLGIAWLDGREAAHAEHGEGAMTLRTAVFDAQLQRTQEMRLDAMTCDCCQTDTALTARGPLLVYRDRTEEEIRDIVVTRLQGDAWTSAQPVHADQWKMPGCPVNGPAVAARGDNALVAWYTAAGDVPTLKLARSGDAGEHFTAPLLVDRGEAVQGRVDVAVNDDAAWLLWLREDAQGQSLQLARYAPDLSRELQRIEVAKLQGRGRGTGFAQLELSGDAAYVVWTDVVGGQPQLRGARIARY